MRGDGRWEVESTGNRSQTVPVQVSVADEKMRERSEGTYN